MTHTQIWGYSNYHFPYKIREDLRMDQDQNEIEPWVLSIKFFIQESTKYLITKCTKITVLRNANITVTIIINLQCLCLVQV